MYVLEGMSESDSQVVGSCLRAACEGPFFPDWEFATLMGVDRGTVQALADAWPTVSPSQENRDIVQNAMLNLVGYPHAAEDELESFVVGGADVIERVLRRFTGRAR